MKTIKALTLYLALVFLIVVSPLHATVKHPEAAEHVVLNTNKTEITYLRSFRVGNIDLAYELIKMNAHNGTIIKRSPLTLQQSASPFMATPDGFKLLSKTGKGIAVIHNGTGKTLRTLPYPKNNSNWRPSPAISPNTVLLALATSQNIIYLVHTGTGKIVKTIDANKLTTQATNSRINAIQFSPDNRSLAIESKSSNSSTLHLYDYNKQTLIAQITLPKTSANNITIRFSKNGKQILIYSERQIQEGITFIDLNTKSVSIKKRRANHHTYANFSADDKSIISYTSNNKTLLIENIKTGEISKKIYTQLPQFHNITQSADRSTLILSNMKQNNRDDDGFILLDSNTGRTIREIKAK